jgi:hypothetical protein
MRSFTDIKTQMQLGITGEARGFLRSGPIVLGDYSTDVGLPIAEVELKDAPSRNRRTLRFRIPPESEVQLVTDPPVVHTPTFVIQDERLLVQLNDERDISPKPFDRLSRPEQSTAYLIMADVAEAIQRERQAGTLGIA